MKKLGFLALGLVLFFSQQSLASYQQGQSVTAGGEGFRLTKMWGGSAGTRLQIAYYGKFSQQCNASTSSGSVSRLTFFIKVNGRYIATSETECGIEHRGSGPVKYAIVELVSDDARYEFGKGKKEPWFFNGLDMSQPLAVELWIQNIVGDYDSKDGDNYHFTL